MPSSILQQYESLLLSNLSAIQTVESTLRNVTWFLPGRFEDAEVASEGLYALLNIVSGYHDTLLSKHLDPSLSLPPHPFAQSSSLPPAHGSSASASKQPVAPPDGPPSNVRLSPLLPPPSEHTRYTRYWTARSSTYRKASRLLVTLQYVQLLVEMLSKKRSERGRWRVVLGLETVKTMLKLIMMGITKRPVLSPPIPQREYDLFSLPSSVLSNVLPSRRSPAAERNTNVRPAVASVPPGAPLRAHLLPLSSALPEDHLSHPLSLVPELDTPGYLTSELIEVTLTWVHIALLIRASRQSQYRPASLPTLSTRLTPYLVPLLLSLLARRLRPSPTDGPHASLLLADHYAQADRRLALRALLTGPMWVGWTRPKIMRLVKGLERVPVVGLVGELMEGYLGLVDDYFYYTSS